jgi:pimeloyl-ACP methyl ester carboxylesterase
VRFPPAKFQKSLVAGNFGMEQWRWPSMADKEGFVRNMLKVNGYAFDAISAGPEGGQLVLFLHGFPQFADAWLEIMPPISNAGFHAVAVDQRGYSPGARPSEIADYAVDLLTSDVLAFADAVGAKQFHLVAHDWGGVLAWQIAAQHPHRLLTLTVLSTAHIDAFLHAVETDDEQKEKSKYISFFRMPGGLVESYLLADNAQRLRSVYQGKLSASAVESNVRRLSEDGALTAALNWYRALDLAHRIGPITVPTLYVWGDNDLAVGETAAVETAEYVTGPYHFERLHGVSHWLQQEASDRIVALLLAHLGAGPREMPGE